MVREAVALLKRAGFRVIVAYNDTGDWLIHCEHPVASRPHLVQQPNMASRVE